MGNSQLWIFLIFMALSGISWLLQKLREQARIKRAKDAARQRFEEELRTGRTEDSAPRPGQGPAPLRQETERQREVQELAARRQEQLRELRRQQQQQQQRSRPGAAPSSAQGTAGRSTAPARPETPARSQSAQPSQRTTVPPRERAQSRKGPDTSTETREEFARKRQIEQREREQASQLAAAAADAAQRASVLRHAAQAASQSAAAVRAAPRIEPVRSVRAMFFADAGKARSRTELLRLMAAAEVLGPPVSQR